MDRLEFEVLHEVPAKDHNGEMVGVRVRLTEPIPDSVDMKAWVEGVKDVGEHLARLRGIDYGRVWVWVYGVDMDEKGPAIAVSYVGDGSIPATEFTPFAIMSAYYLGKTAQLDPQRIADRLRESGADEERIEAVLRSISAEA